MQLHGEGGTARHGGTWGMPWALLGQAVLNPNPGDRDLTVPRHPEQTGRQRAAAWAGTCWSWEEDGVCKGSALTHCLQGLGFFPK